MIFFVEENRTGNARKVEFVGGAQHLILFLASARRDDRRCGEIINLHIESGATNHNQTNSNSSFYSALENMFRSPDSQIPKMFSKSR